MKRIFALILLTSLALSCAGCGSAPAPAPAESAAAEASEQISGESPVSAPEPEITPRAEAADSKAGEREAGEREETDAAHSSVLVVDFSATGTTRGVAERIAALTGADLAEIVPLQPYTAEDLNYNDRTTRATVEQYTPEARPEIANEISLEGYTTVYLGYPIWWGDTPRILSTFVESHDFTGITVIPFCTSASSIAGRTGEKLGEQAGTGTFLSSTRLDASVSEPDLQAWIAAKSGGEG